jgi:transposase
MRKIREILRLRHEAGRSQREIARACGVAKTTVRECLRRSAAAGIGWPLPEGISETELDEKLFPAPPPSRRRPLPDCRHIYDELREHRKVNLTLYQLWLEYREQHPEDGYGYTQFCEYYRRWRGKLDYVMRQEHRAGEKLFVDYGEGLQVTDPKTGEKIPTQLFVGVWGASNFTYAEATLTQKLRDWIGPHVRAFEYFERVPHAVVPDNLKSGVKTPCFYEPEINPSYAEMAAWYKTAILPARPKKARDKAKVENGVLVAKRWILSVLRHRTFFSLGELNAAIRELLEVLNARPMRKLKKSRRELFETLDRPAAKPLPERRYEFAQWSRPRVNIDYHIEVEGHFYSVPYQLLREKLDVRLTAHTLEAFFKGKRIAAHVRSYRKGGYTTLKEHMPPEHRRFAEWTPSRMISWARKSGPFTAELVEKVLSTKAFPEQGYRACLGIIRLGERYEEGRLEAAARRALAYNAISYRSVRSILANGLDRRSESDRDAQGVLPLHENIRGGGYYH